MTTRPLPERTATGWSIPIGDGSAELTQSSYDLQVVIGGITSVLLSATIEVARDGSSLECEPESDEASTAISALGRATLLTIDDGTLIIDFIGGSRVSVAPDPHYEAFEIFEVGPHVRDWLTAEGTSGPRWDDARVSSFSGSSLTDQFAFISLPGGGVSSFTSTSLTQPSDNY